jgi:phage terminase large subunit
MQIKIKTTQVFEKNYLSTKKIIINRGWTRSSKTYSLLQLCLFWLITWKIDETGKHFDTWILTIVRKEKTTIKATALRDREHIVQEAWCIELLTEKHYNRTDKTFKREWRVVEFVGADDQQKLRWWKRDILYCNEANSLLYDQEFFQLFIRTGYKTFIDFNPDNEDIRINTELEQKRQHTDWDVEVIISTYKDNPFLPDTQIREIEKLEKDNPTYWRIYWLWEYWKLEWVIYNNRQIIGEIPAEAELIVRGLDFGYTNDPTALVSVYKRNRSLVIHQEIYETWLTNNDIDSKMISLWLDQTIKIYWDSSEPKSIEELRRRRRNINPVTKWVDSIKFWIDTVQQFQLYITASSKETIREIKWYCRDTDKKTWKVLNKPIDSNNHALDAMRYAIMMKFDTRIIPKQTFYQSKRS